MLMFKTLYYLYSPIIDTIIYTYLFLLLYLLHCVIEYDEVSVRH